ncbi:galactose mutarotase-like domain-containing protein [Desarmillaria tabescens]|uniref:Glucose-6-phosphate 1-epimerase n=1 Tax=Armillaria tabescens TaxID=1929756 RepID=A0AA39NG49_ARMTA|nr:galactose mutarotase-like domain-containing protein [Desarmillaria tabescens]KAK0465017.1 galactose mutarotase-like domain-containing protein [Desarmillaria tabescens]
MPVQFTSGKLVLSHPKGPVVEVLLYGASVISWKSGTKSKPELSERLFVSQKAALDGSKPVRGGIPVVFPCFGAPIHPDHAHLSQHGFARNSVWSWDGTLTDEEEYVSIKLTLQPMEAIAAVYSKPFLLTYVVTLSEFDLKTDLHVQNTSSSDDNLEFHALFHNYIRAPSADVIVGPLQGFTYYDKTEPTEEGKSTPKVEARPGVDVKKFTDSVYENTNGKYEVTWSGGGLDITAKNLKDVVVWNPQEAGRKIGDMEENGWENFVCVEPGYVRGFVNLEPGGSWTGGQTLSVIHEERRLTNL